MELYRAGAIKPVTEYGYSTRDFDYCDSLRPDDRQGRVGAIYCVPDFKDTAMWISGHNGDNDALVPPLHAVTIKKTWLNKVYAYPLSKWEASFSFFTTREKAYTEFWEAGIPLSQWSDHDPRERFWEVLVPSEAILKVRKENPYDLYDELNPTDTFMRNLVARKYSLALMEMELV